MKDKAKEILGEREGLKPKDLQDTLRQKHGIHVKAGAATKGVAQARKERDEEEASFDMFQGLFEALKEQNPGTVTEIVMCEGRFKTAFLCPGPCARAWSYCPRIIALDGTHGTSAFKGVVLLATALDGAGEIFPLTIGSAPSECNESWRFFVRNLANALNIRDTPVTIISDRCKGINNGVSEFLPRAAHSYCAFHISQNMGQFGSDVASRV